MIEAAKGSTCGCAVTGGDGGGRVVVTAAGAETVVVGATVVVVLVVVVLVVVEVDVDVVVEVVVSSCSALTPDEPLHPLTLAAVSTRAPTTGTTRQDLIRASVAPPRTVSSAWPPSNAIGSPSRRPPAPAPATGRTRARGSTTDPAGTHPTVACLATHYNVDFSEHYLAKFSRREASGSWGGTPATGGTRRTSCSSTPSSTSAPVCGGCARKPPSTRS